MLIWQLNFPSHSEIDDIYLYFSGKETWEVPVIFTYVFHHKTSKKPIKTYRDCQRASVWLWSWGTSAELWTWWYMYMYIYLNFLNFIYRQYCYQLYYSYFFCCFVEIKKIPLWSLFFNCLFTFTMECGAYSNNAMSSRSSFSPLLNYRGNL